MEKKPLLSLVVPTKDRYFYLKHLINLIKSFEFDDFELIIQDNTYDNKEILDYLENNNFDGLKYFYNQEPISVSDNSTQAILNSSGEYICFIGDDDGVTRYVMDAVKWMKENKIAILKSIPVNYKWPSFVSSKYYNVSSCALFNSFSMKYRIVDTRESLRRLLSSGIDTLDYMPKVYNGIAKRSTLDRIFDKCGSFYPGPSPDMANAVALALEEDFYAFVDAPIIIGGHSVNLGGNAARYKHRYGPLEEQPFIDQKYIDNWSPKIPKIWSANTVWPESAITALKAYNATEYLEMIDYMEVHKKFIVENPSIDGMAYALSSSPSQLKKHVFLYTLARKFKGVRNVLKYKFLNMYDGMLLHRNIETIEEAEKLISSSIQKFELIA